MSWNYRIIQMDVRLPQEKWYEVHEVYYNKGKIKFWTSEAVKIDGKSRAEIARILKMIKSDIHRRPILKESELPK